MPGPALAMTARALASYLGKKHGPRIAAKKAAREAANTPKAKANKAIDKKVAGTIRSSGPSPSSQEAAARNLARLRNKRTKYQGN